MFVVGVSVGVSVVASVGVSIVVSACSSSIVKSSSSRTGRKSPSFHRESSRTPKAGLSSRKPSDIILDISSVDKLLSILSFKLSTQGSVQPDLSGSGVLKRPRVPSQNQEA